MAATPKIRHSHSDGRAYYDRKLAEGKTHKEALRCLKRRISDAIYARLCADARQAGGSVQAGPGGQKGEHPPPPPAGSPPPTPPSAQPPPPPPPPLPPRPPP